MESESKTVIQSVSDLLKQVEKTHAYLIVIAGNATIGRMFKLDKPTLTLGRGTDVDVVLDDEAISRRHAQIHMRGKGQVTLVDLQSTNGTFVNGAQISEKDLHDGDKIQIGTTTILKFSYQDSLDEQLQRNLFESATHDGLTKIYNKKYFLDALEKDFAYSLRHELLTSLVMMDVDHFKRINDTYGHQAGDYVLSKVAQRIKDTIRKEDVFARYGGEEFVLLLRQLDAPHAVQCAERLRKLIESTAFVTGGATIRVTLSFGIAVLQGANFKNGTEMIAEADKQLYAAKQGGRNRVCVSETAGQ